MIAGIVLVTGAAGGVGQRLCHVLSRHGFRVRGLVRPEDDTRRLELRGEDLCVGYVQDPECVRRAMRGVDTVIHSAALLPNALELGPRAFQEVNVEGTRNIMQQAIAHRVKWVIAMSTISVVDHVTRTITRGDLLDYVSPPTDHYLASKIEAEKLLFALRPGFGGEVAILRLAYVYGPGNFAVWREPLRLLEQGKLRLIGDGKISFPLIYADDIGNFVVGLLGEATHNEHPSIHVLANPQPTTLRSVFDFIADHLGIARPGRLPLWLARLAASVVDTLPLGWRPGRLKMLTRARVLQFSSGYDLTPILSGQSFGQTRLTPYQEGLPIMLADYTARERVRVKP